MNSPLIGSAKSERASSILLVACTVLALVLANSAPSEFYHQFWSQEYSLALLNFPVHFSLAHIVNDGLMTVFFFVVGLEIKREFLVGELSSMKKASLPIFGAIGGMLVPAALFLWIVSGTSAASGWGIPMATDIAFAVGIVTFLGKRVHHSLKIFLMALAIVDDIGAILVIAIFYSSGINFVALGIAALFLVISAACSRKINSLFFYFIIGIAVWIAFLFSGVHPAIAGVLVAFTIPVRGSTLEKFEAKLHSPVAFIIMPLFALGNAGVSLGGISLTSLSEPVTLGVIIGLVIGKPVGISLLSYLACRFGIASLPSGVAWKSLVIVSILGGIGFTMSLFINNLAFTDDLLINNAKLGVLAASFVAGLVGYVLFSFSRSK